MFTIFCARVISIDRRMIGASLLLILVIAAVASNLHAPPNETLISVNWEAPIKPGG